MEGRGGEKYVVFAGGSRPWPGVAVSSGVIGQCETSKEG